MSQYSPFLINFKTGKFLGLDPWLAPVDAFPTLINAQVNKQILEKRLGYSLFAQMKHGSVAQTTTAITGIKTFMVDGFPYLLIFDTKRVNAYNPVDGTMRDVAGSDIFTGRAIDYFHTADFLGVGYMVNNVDQVYQYTGETSSSMVSTFNYKVGSELGVNDLTTCRFIFVVDDRLCFLDTVERGTWQGQRFRYTATLQTSGVASGSGYVDCPTDKRISTAGMVNNELHVFFEDDKGGALWKIQSTGNSDTPYTWKKISETEGCRAPYSGVIFNDGFACIGLTNILFYDGYKVNYLDAPNLRDILAEFNDGLIRYCYGYYVPETKHVLWTFAASSSTVPDRILDFNTIDNTWTVHKSVQTFFANCIGGFNNQKVPAWSALDDVIASDGMLVSGATVDSREILGSPYPVTLIGCRNSCVYKWNSGAFDGTNDNNGKIEIDIQSAELNPFTKEGRKCRLGKVQFFVDNSSTATFTVSFYKDSSTTAYKTQVVSCDLSNTKAFVTVYADGEIGTFHKIKISHTEKANRPRIHAMILYFSPAGYLDL